MLPRRVAPGMTVLVTRRTQRRTHLLRPEQRINDLFCYLLAVIAKRHGVLVHAAVLMSTHEHLVLTDVNGCLPRFLAELHRMLALCVKALRKWEGEVWDGGKTSVVELRTPEAVIEKLAYVAANPVAAGLVRTASDWPGITTIPENLGRARMKASRPKLYLDPENPIWPGEATLELAMPPRLRMTDDAVRSAVAAELAELEVAVREEGRANGRTVLGAERLRRLSPFLRAKSWEPLRALNPTFAVGRHQKLALLAGIKVVRAFRLAYQQALSRWRAGIWSVVFPRETWLMRTLYRVRVAPA
jgi:putative transposase